MSVQPEVKHEIIKLCVGVLGVLPTLTLALASLFGSVAMALVFAGVALITVVSILPRYHGGARPPLRTGSGRR